MLIERKHGLAAEWAERDGTREGYARYFGPDSAMNEAGVGTDERMGGMFFGSTVPWARGLRALGGGGGEFFRAELPAGRIRSRLYPDALGTEVGVRLVVEGRG
jgi:hypothetical protein